MDSSLLMTFSASVLVKIGLVKFVGAAPIRKLRLSVTSLSLSVFLNMLIHETVVVQLRFSSYDLRSNDNGHIR